MWTLKQAAYKLVVDVGYMFYNFTYWIATRYNQLSLFSNNRSGVRDYNINNSSNKPPIPNINSAYLSA
jgi:hypothetical protein